MNLLDKINEHSKTHPEFKPMLYDILRTITIQIIAQLLFSINNPSISFLNNTFIQSSIYLCIGVIVFWLIVYRLLLSYNVFTPLNLLNA